MKRASLWDAIIEQAKGFYERFKENSKKYMMAIFSGLAVTLVGYLVFSSGTDSSELFRQLLIDSGSAARYCSLGGTCIYNIIQEPGFNVEIAKRAMGI